MMGRYEKGVSAVAALAALAVLMIIFFTVKLVPEYIEHVYVQDALKFVAKNNPKLEEMDKADIQSALSKYMTVNAVANEHSKSFKIYRLPDRMLVNSIYEIRVPMIHNIEAVLVFKSQLDTSNPDACCDYLVEYEEEED